MPKQGPGIHVRVRNNDLDAALRIFSKRVKDEKLIIRIKENEYFEKPSAIKRRKRMSAVLRNRHRQEEE